MLNGRSFETRVLAVSAIVALILSCYIINDVEASGGEIVWAQSINPSDAFDCAYGVAVDNSGVYAVGVDQFPNHLEWRIEKRSLSTGALLWNKTIDLSTSNADTPYGVAVDMSGVYVVGYDGSAGNGQWRIEKRNSTNGLLLWNQTSNPSADMDGAYGVAVDYSGIYVVGYDRVPGDSEWRIEKRSSLNGSLLWAQTNNLSPNYEEAYGVAVDTSGVYVVGYDLSGGNGEWRIEKRSLTDGSLLWNQTANPSTGLDEARSVAVDGSGVYVVGHENGYARWRIERRNPSNGVLVWNQTSSAGQGSNQAFGVAVDGSGVYAVGYYTPAYVHAWHIEKRSLADGLLLWDQTREIGSDYDEARGVAVDASGIYVVGCDFSPGNYQWRIEKRGLGVAPKISDMASLVLLIGENQTYFIYANPSRMTRAEATYDVASGSIIFGMCLNLQNQGFDTRADWVSQDVSDKGRLLLTGATALMFGGPNPHWCVSYLEAHRLTPVYFKSESLGDGQHLKFVENSTGTAKVDRLASSIDFAHEDYFVIMTSIDLNNNRVFVSYGFDWKGTWAAGIYTKSIVFNILACTNSYYIMHWVDANTDGIPQPSEMTQVATG